MSTLTKKEKALLKGALRRIFARSDLHKQIKTRAIIKHSDPKRKKVKTWVRCESCLKPEAISNTTVDHVIPLIPPDSSWEEMTLQFSWEELISKIWCNIENLQLLCSTCHDLKTSLEREQKKQVNKARKKLLNNKKCAKISKRKKR